MQPPLAPATVRELVRSHLHLNPVAADLRCSLFVAAVQNYKRDSVLRPFPPRYLRGEIKDFEELVRDCILLFFDCDLQYHVMNRLLYLGFEFLETRWSMQHPSYRTNYCSITSLSSKIQHKPAKDIELYGENIFWFLQQKDVSSLPSIRDLVRLESGDGDHHLALVHWVLSSKSFDIKTIQKEEVLLKFEYCWFVDIRWKWHTVCHHFTMFEIIVFNLKQWFSTFFLHSVSLTI